jgi:AcrR family transcriptional regulator
MSKKLSTQFESNREMILKTTSEMFCSKGISATSISDIAKAVKLSKGTVSYYFPSKEHLIYEATDHHLSVVTNSILDWIETTTPGMSVSDALFRLVSCIFDTVNKCRLHICLIYDAIMGHEVIDKMIKDEASKWHTMVSAGLVKAGHIEPKKITEAFFMALDNVILRRAMDVSKIYEHEICEHIAKYI